MIPISNKEQAVRPLAGSTVCSFLEIFGNRNHSVFIFFFGKKYDIYFGMNHDKKSSIINSSTLLKNYTNIIQFSD